MKREIERKFLVVAEKLPPLVKGKEITNVYLATKPEIRVRTVDKKAFLTIKGGGSLTGDEFEYKIPLAEGRKLLNYSNLKIEKTRFHLPLNNLTWSIDFYKGDNKGLVLAEIELPSEAAEFKKPLWLEKEVTADLRFRNLSLAQNPFNSWKEGI